MTIIEAVKKLVERKAGSVKRGAWEGNQRKVYTENDGSFYIAIPGLMDTEFVPERDDYLATDWEVVE